MRTHTFRCKCVVAWDDRGIAGFTVKGQRCEKQLAGTYKDFKDMARAFARHHDWRPPRARRGVS